MAVLTTEENLSVTLQPPLRNLKQERQIIIITSLGHFLCHFSEAMYGAILVAVMREFVLTEATASSMATLGFMLLGFGALPVGLLSDAWGSVRLFRIYFFALAGAAAFVSIATGPYMLFWGLTILGLAASIYHPVGLALISLGVQARGRAMGINGVAGSVGIALGPALGTLFREPGWWRVPYVIIVIVSIACGIFMWYAIRENFRLPEHEQTTPSVKEDAPSETTTRQKGFRFPRLFFLYAAMLMGGLNYRVLITALPTYLSGEEATSMQLTIGAGMVFVTLMVGALGQIMGGWLADRFGSRVIYPILIGCVLPVAFLLAWFPQSWLVFPISCVLALVLFAQQPVENSLLAECTSSQRRGLSYGAKFALTFGIGALGAPVVGFLWQFGLDSAFYFMSGAALLMGTFAITAVRNLSKRKVSPSY